MDDRRRTLAAITLIIGFLVIVAVIVGIIVSGKKTISPVPEDNSAIKIIFITPTATPVSSPVTPSPVITPTKKVTPKPTSSP